MKASGIFHFFASILIVMISAPALAAENCPPGSISYKKSLALVLSDFVALDENISMNHRSGRLNLSISGDHVVESDRDRYVSRIKIRTSYGQIRDQFGLKFRESEYLVQTNPNCTGFEILEKETDPKIVIGRPDEKLSFAVHAALKFYTETEEEIIPENRHAGGHMLRIHQPNICAEGSSASVNLVRVNQISTGQAYRTTTYLVDLASGRVIRSQVRPGRHLPSLCFNQ